VSTPRDRAALARTPLVLIPGLLCDRLVWAPQVAGLADLADAWVPDHTRHDSMAAIAGAILAEAPARQFALAGFSMGGFVAFEIMRQAPERVTRLAPLDTRATADTPDQAARRVALMARVEQGDFAGVADELLALHFHPERHGDARLTQIGRQMALNVGAAAFARQEPAIIGRPDSRPDLPGYRCATLVLCGREDGATPLSGHEEMARLIAGARLHVIEHCGHLSTLERPAETTAALREWLTET
jgi:pimeloyl-ACP methyl ester carboxylesterase